jgi:hypothetical protein
MTQPIVLKMDRRLSPWNVMYWLKWRRRFFKADRAYLAAFNAWHDQAYSEAQFQERKGVIMKAMVTQEGTQSVEWFVPPPPKWKDYWP